MAKEDVWEKEDVWDGYYARFLSQVDPVDALEKSWGDGDERAELVLPHISPDSLVLEIACGIGRVSRFVAPHCKHLYCTDILDEALREAERTLAAYSNVSFHKTTGYDLGGFGTSTVDCIYSFTTFFHFEFELVVRYFSEIVRVLRPKGVGVIEFKAWLGEADLTQLLTKIERVGGIESYEAKVDKWRYVSKEMLFVLCDYHGLQVLDPDVTQFTFRTP